MKRVQKQNQKFIHWGLLTFLMGAGLLLNANPSETEAIEFSNSHLGTFEGGTVFTTSSSTGVQPALAIELKTPYNSQTYYESQNGSLVLKNTQEGATIRSATLKGQTLVNLIGEVSSMGDLWAEDEHHYNLNLPAGNGQPTITFRLEQTLPANKTYTLFIKMDHYEAGVIHIDMRKGHESTSNQKYFGANGWQKLVFTTTSDATHIRIFPRNGVDNVYSISKEIILLEGDYTDQPIPSYFTGTQSVEMPVLTITGKNLFDGVVEEGSINELTGENEPYSNHKRSSNFIEVKPNTSYSFSINEQKYNGRLFIYDKNKKFIRSILAKEFTSTKDEEYYLRFRVEKGDISKGENFQLEHGTMVTSYEPYRSNTISFNEPITLRSNGSVSDEIDLMTGKWTQRIGEANEILDRPVIRILKMQTETVFSSIKQTEIKMVGTIDATIASVTVPTAPLTFRLNPNLEPDQQFIASEFSLTNAGQAPLTIELKEFIQITDVLNDVAPDYYDEWNNLTKEESKQIALGLVPQASESWLTFHPGTYYVAETSNVVLGRVKSQSTVDFKFTALHGQAFDQLPNPQYRLTFVFGF